MFRRGLALSIALGLFTAAQGQTVNVTLVPNPAGPYSGGEQVFVDVNLTLTGGGASQLLRIVQLDLNETHPDLLASANYPVQSGSTFTGGFWDFGSLANCPGTCGIGYFIEAISGATRPNIGSITWEGLAANAAQQIALENGVAKKIGQVRVTLPVAPGSYDLNVLGTTGANGNTDTGARVAYGFGVLTGDDLVSLTEGNGGATGGLHTFVIDGGCEVASSFPAIGGTLWRATKNRIAFTLDSDTCTVDAGDIEIVEMLAGGGFGANVAGTFGITQTGASVVMQDSASGLTNKKWYRVRATGADGSLTVDLCYLVQAGDASGDKFVNFADLVNINMSIPSLPAQINDTNRRRDINGDNFINFADMVTANGFIPGLNVPVPTGHTCP